VILLKRLRVENFKLLRRLDLTFPRQGSVLVEGLNESGKSTLFESVFYALYGVPLVAEGKGRGNLESVIRYGADSASVELWLEVGETELEIRRWLGRGKPTQATLVVRPAGAPEERVAGVLAVNARVVEELGGLDGEALLNSCFVEQKKLSKLEDLAGAQRKDSLRKLLNLERLTELADGFKVTTQDERMLAEARNRLEMAEVAAQRPRVASEMADLEAALRGTSQPDASFSKSDAVGWGAGPRRPAPDPRPAAWDKPTPYRRNDASEGGERPWAQAAADLAKVDGSLVLARRRGIAALAAGGLVLVLVVGLFLSGRSVALWALPLAVALMLVAAASFRSMGNLAGKVAELESQLRSYRDGLVARMGELEGRHRTLAERLGNDGEALDVEECRLQVERLSHRLEVKRQAADLVEGAMERIVRMVLPNTERNLGQILPLLTAGRYHEARIA